MAKKKGNSKPKGSGRGRRKQPQPPPGLSLDRKLDLLGIGLLALGALTILGMASPNKSQVVEAWLKILGGIFGWGVYVVPLGMAASGLWLLLRHFGDRLPVVPAERYLGLGLLYLSLLISMHFFLFPADAQASWALAAAGKGGGYIGAALLEIMLEAIDWAGAAIVLGVGWLIALILTAGLSTKQWVGLISHGLDRLRGRPAPSPSGDLRPPVGDLRPPVGDLRPPAGDLRPAASPKASPPIGDLRPPIGDLRPPAGDLRPPVGDLRPAVPPAPAYDQPIIIGADQPWELPALADILEPGLEGVADDEYDRKRAHIIEDTLASFGAPARVVEINRGPVITQFGVEPDFVEVRGGKRTKVKVGKISALADDLALALAAPSIRIEAPVPGKGYVGIEVPNQHTALVALRDVMESEGFKRLKGTLRLGLGQDVSGRAVSADLTAMPHLLIAGTTGSGKSVCVNSIIASLLLQNTPDDLKLLMVDPKRVELTQYNGLPHLLAPVVVDLERIVPSLQWVTREMDERYRRFARAGARNIADHNERIVGHGEALSPESAPTGSAFGKKLPYLVVIIDELADLMMLSPDETERTLTRLAQMARATGIHLIIATQRPSVDVVTGLIKANFPARISFAVASSVDSRVVLDTPGAERLLGRGDMLFQSPDASTPLRMQGVFVSDAELHRLARYWKNARGIDSHQPPAVSRQSPAPAPTLKQPPLWDDLRAEMEEKSAEGEDELYADAVQVVREMRKASISLLQRRLRIGYTRAARLIDLLEEKGIVGPAKPGAQQREVIDFGEPAQ